MKRKIAVIISVVLVLSLITGTVAYAGNGNGSGDTADKGQERQKFLEQLSPLIQQIKANREQIQALHTELIEVHQQARAHVAELRENTDEVTDEQLDELKGLVKQLRDCRNDLVDTNPDMVRERLRLRNMKRSRNYEEILAAYGSVIRLQEQRMEQMQKMIQINEQIIEV